MNNQQIAQKVMKEFFDKLGPGPYYYDASAVELEKDILTEETYVKIMKTLIYEEVK